MIMHNTLEQTFIALYKEPTGKNTRHVIYWCKAYISDCHSVSFICPLGKLWDGIWKVADITGCLCHILKYKE